MDRNGISCGGTDYRNSSSDNNRPSMTGSLGSVDNLLSKEAILEDGVRKAPARWKYLFAFSTKKHFILLLFATLAGIFSGAIAPVTAIFFGRVFQAFTDFGGKNISASTFQSKVKTNTLILAALATADWLFTAIFIFLWVFFGELQARRARILLFNGLLEKSSTFYDTVPQGIAAMTPRLQTHIRDLQIATSQPFGYMFSALTGAVASFIIAMKYEWSLALILLSTQPINALVLGFMSSRIQKHVQSQMDQLAVAAKNATNAFSAIETVKSFCAEETEVKKFASAIKQAASCYIRQVHGNALQIGHVRCMTLLTFMIGFWYGSHLVISGKRTTGDVVTTFFSCLEVTSAVQGILPQMMIMEKGRVSGALLTSIAGDFRTDSELDVGKTPLTCKGGITMHNVTFSYPSRSTHEVLKNVSCKFPPGKTSFIIGRSGSGKSSCAQLLLRLYDPSRGQLQLDGCALEDLDLHWLRRNITLIEQESVLFDGTIFENIALGIGGGEDTTLCDVKAAAEFALLLNTIHDLPNGFQSRVGQKGHSLSGGQRQRMAIARARIRDTPILILDESTSALDEVSRLLIISALRQWRKDKTTIFITHDLSLIESNDFVCVFEDGYLVESNYKFELSAESILRFQRLQDVDLPMATKESGAPSWSCEEVKSDFALDSDHAQLASLDAISKPRPRMATISETLDNSVVGSSELPFPSQNRYSISARSTSFSQSSFSPIQAAMKSPLSANFKHFESTNLIKGRTESDSLELDVLEITGEFAIQRRFNTSSSRRERNRTTPDLYPHRAGDFEIRQPDMRQKDYFEPSTKKLSLLQILSSVWPMTRKRARHVLVGASFCTLIHAISIPIFSWLFSKLISTFYEKEGAQEQALKWSLGMLALSLLDGSACYGMAMTFEYSAQAWVDSVRLQAIRRVIYQPKEFFEDDRNRPSQLSFSLDRNAEEMRNILGRFVSFTSVAIIMMAIVVIWCLAISWKLTLVGLALTPISWGVARMYQIISEKLECRSNDAGDVAAAILNEAFTNIKTVRALTLERFFRRKHTTAANEALSVGVKRALHSGLFYGVSEAIMVFNNCLIFFYGAKLVSDGTISVENVLLVFSQLMFALGNVTNIVKIIPQVSSSKDTATRLLALAHLQRNSHESGGKIRPETIQEIELSDLIFSYSHRHEEAVLRNVDLKFIQGTTTALVGASGSGKSTIASLLLKMYPVVERDERKQPMISLGGRDIHRIHTGTLRSLICIVPQTPVLLPATVAENIAYGQDWTEGSDRTESIRAAAKAAGIDDFLLSLPSGYDTLIGDGGLGLSGGQTQRVAIARALFRKPTVLILDEATSALDRDSAGMVFDTVKRLIRENRQMTIIIITHSREMMLLADRLVVLDQGRIVDQGSFIELSCRPGPFATLLSGGMCTEDNGKIRSCD